MSLQETTKYARTICCERGNKGRIGQRSIVHCLFQYSVLIEDIK